ncbi:MAG: glycosyltransferase family A protein [bacterium]
MPSTSRFLIFSAGYNCAAYVENCIRGVQRQTLKNYVHIVVDDASTDDTWARIEKFKDTRVVAHRNATNKTWLGNAVQYLKPQDEDIVVVLDLDDWLFDETALQTLQNEYDQHQCWLTYGDYCEADKLPKSKWIQKIRAAFKMKPKLAGQCRPLPADVLQRRAFREVPFSTSHLRTFKGFLWKAIQPRDLLDWNGQYPAMAGDVAIMLPMLEMCPPGKIRYIRRALCVYNNLNPLNNYKVDCALEQKVEQWFKEKPKYPVLQKN